MIPKKLDLHDVLSVINFTNANNNDNIVITVGGSTT